MDMIQVAEALDFFDFFKDSIPAEEHEDGTWSVMGCAGRFSSLDELTRFLIRDAAKVEEAGLEMFLALGLGPTRG
jgi:hypothetical protein